MNNNLKKELLQESIRINIKLNNKRKKYTLASYFANFIIFNKDIKQSGLTKYIQEKVINTFNDDNFILKEGITKTINHLLFIHQGAHYEQANMQIQDSLKKQYEEKLKQLQKNQGYIDIMNDNTEKRHYEALTKIKKEAAQTKKAAAEFVGYSQEIIEKSMKLETIIEHNEKILKEQKEYSEYMINQNKLSEKSLNSKQKIKEEEIKKMQEKEMKVIEELEYKKDLLITQVELLETERNSRITRTSKNV